MSTIRVLVVDDHPLFRDGLVSALRQIDNIEIIGEAGSGQEAINLAAQKPSLILMDIQLPGIDGIEASRRIKTAHPEVGILMLTMLHDDNTIFAAMRAGACGYILKGVRADELQHIIQLAHAGHVMFSPAISEKVMAYFAQKRQNLPPHLQSLTEREMGVLRLIAQGHSNEQIGELLNLRPQTVRNYVHTILLQLQAADRYEAAQIAKEHGIK